MALAERYKEIEQQLDNSTHDTAPNPPPLPPIYGGGTDKDVMSETAAEEMILRMEAWNIRLSLRNVRQEKPLDTGAVEAFQNRYTALNALLETTRYSDADFCVAPELAPGG
jgi:hypothetical protein